MSSAAKPAQPTRKAIATRSALVQAAIVVFSRQHYRDAKISDICKEAGKAVGVFYRYFDNKQDIFSAAVDVFFARLSELEPKIGEAGEKAGFIVDSAIAVYWNTFRDFYGVVSGLFEIGIADEEVAAIWRGIRAAGIRRFSARIAEQKRRGKCADIDEKLGASALLSMLEFSCYNWNSGRLDFEGQVIPDEKAIFTLAQLIRYALQIDGTSGLSSDPDLSG